MATDLETKPAGEPLTTAPPDPSRGPTDRLAAARDLFLWAVAVTLAFAFRDHNLAVTGMVLAVFGVREVFWFRRGDFLFFAFGMVAGPVLEIFAVATNVWTYTNPSFLGIPVWLPFAWGITVVTFVRASQNLFGPHGGEPGAPRP